MFVYSIINENCVSFAVSWKNEFHIYIGFNILHVYSSFIFTRIFLNVNKLYCLGVMSCSKLLKRWNALSHILNSSKLDNRAILAPSCVRRLHLSNYVNRRFDQFEDTDKRTHFNEKLEKGPSLQHFIANSGETIDNYEQVSVGERIPYLEELYSGHGRKGTHRCSENIFLNPYIVYKP